MLWSYYRHLTAPKSAVEEWIHFVPDEYRFLPALGITPQQCTCPISIDMAVSLNRALKEDSRHGPCPQRSCKPALGAAH